MMSIISELQRGQKYKKPVTKVDDSLNEKTVRVPEHVCFYVEQELSSYPIYKAAIAQLELDLEDVINQYGQVATDRLSSRSDPGDPVNLSALRSLMIEEKIKYYMSRIRRVESGICLLTDAEKEIATRKYFSEDRYSNDEIIEEFHLNRCTFYKIRQDIIFKFSMIFGLL
jgi:hypothetical protein